MIKTCSHEDYHELMHYLEQEPVYHTFIISDIAQYGFDKDYQTVYLQKSENRCCGIFLRYYNNFIVAGDTNEIIVQEIVPLITSEITTIMGKADLVDRICSGLKRDYTYEQKMLYILEKGNEVQEEQIASRSIRIAGLEDVDRIYEFLMGIEQLRALYSQKAMIENRIRSGEGIHIIMEEEGTVIAHGNSAASTDRTVMLGGIGVLPSYRRQGIGKKIINRLCQEILKKDKTPCIFTGDANVIAMCSELGFTEYGMWATAQANHNELC